MNELISVLQSFFGCCVKKGLQGVSMKQGDMATLGTSAGKYRVPGMEGGERTLRVGGPLAQQAWLPWLLDCSQETERRQTPHEKEHVTQLSHRTGPTCGTKAGPDLQQERLNSESLRGC